MRVLLLVIGIVLKINVEAQVQRVGIFVVKTWEVPVEVIPKAEQTRYAQFREGVIHYSHGKTLACRLNYSMLYGEMQMIDSKGDTLSLSLNNEPMIIKVIIGEDEFFSLYGRGFVEVIASYPSLKLARKQLLRIVYGEQAVSNGYNIEKSSISDMPTLRQIYHQKTPGLMKIAKEATYLLIDANNRFYPAKKSVFIQLFSRHRKQIDGYLKENQINFKKPEDLQKLVEYCSTLAES